LFLRNREKTLKLTLTTDDGVAVEQWQVGMTAEAGPDGWNLGVAIGGQSLLAKIRHEVLTAHARRFEPSGLDAPTFAIYYRVAGIAYRRREKHYAALNVDHALGLFFKDHPTVNYEDVIEHVEL
jgi:hypothetical protein